MRFPSRTILTWVAITGLLSCLPGLAGCAVHRETTLSRTARQREIQSLIVARERLENEREFLAHRSEEVRRQIGVARAESVRAEARLRATLADLSFTLARLQAAEQDLAAAQQRAGEIEKELQPLRSLENTLRDQEALRGAAEKRVELLRREVATAEAEAQKATTELQPKVEALRQQLAQAEQVAKAITDAQAAVQAAAKVLAPPPPAQK
ncbi:MAG: hypothetical protein KDC98_24485 [Planctomycetes bacterium]|nr:hypothetical protein [Planctomycetota bacterium]